MRERDMRDLLGARRLALMVGRTVRKGALLSSTALIAALSASSGAWAQCTDNFNRFAINIPTPGQIGLAQDLTPLGRGTSLSALTATINTVNTAFLTTTSAFVSAPANPRPDQLGGGVWGRSVAGSVDSETTSTGTIPSPLIIGNPPVNQGAISGTQNCRTSLHQDYWGYQVGSDFSILNHGGSGANWHWGVTAGSIQAKTKDTTPAGSFFNPNTVNGVPGFNGIFFTPAGSLSETTQVPFVGIYTAFTKGGFFADGQVRWDFYQNSLTDPNNGLTGQGVDARGLSVTYNMGYKIPLHAGWFVEPSAGFVWSRVNVDPLNSPGVLQTAFPFAPYARGTVTIGDIESDLLRWSFTVGNSFTHAGVTWQPYFTASVFHELNGNVTATSVVSGTGAGSLIEGLTLTQTSTRGVGTYGQYALGTAAVLGNSGWLGYVRGDYRQGDHIEGWSVTGGLRWQFNPVNAPLK
jgi:autotransporter-like protein